MVGLKDFLFNFPNSFENIGFSILITISSDSQIYFIFAGIIPEGSSSSNDGIRRGHFNMREEVVR